MRLLTLQSTHTMQSIQDSTHLAMTLALCPLKLMEFILFLWVRCISIIMAMRYKSTLRVDGNVFTKYTCMLMCMTERWPRWSETSLYSLDAWRANNTWRGLINQWHNSAGDQDDQTSCTNIGSSGHYRLQGIVPDYAPTHVLILF